MATKVNEKALNNAKKLSRESKDPRLSSVVRYSRAPPGSLEHVTEANDDATVAAISSPLIEEVGGGDR